MSKRRLSDQQRTRIRSQQAQSDDKAASVIANFGRRVEARFDDGSTKSCVVKANIPPLVAGDRITVSMGGAVSSRLDRDTELLRPDARNNLRAVAANVEQVFIMIAPEPQAHASLIDRYLVAVRLSEMTPVLVLNKIDLLSDSSSELIALCTRYEQLGLAVFRISSDKGLGLADLKEQFANTTSVLVGQSGVGKSSLINALLGESVTAVGELSAKEEQGDTARLSAKGTHTTTTARLFELPTGGSLIDSPGIREFHLWHVKKEDLILGFPDLLEHAHGCKFRNCKHQSEQGCALAAARRKDPRLEQRWQSYLHILNSL